MVTTGREKFIPYGWKHPNTSPFAGRIVSHLPVVDLARAWAPVSVVKTLRIRIPRELVWLAGGEERDGYRVLGRRVAPDAEPDRTPRVRSSKRAR
ncbi:hypothetical protein [Stigmatella aurantiaca]|uniref:Uncharacterized protein n=1 Tax=Stigmatella aurantiaca (strain DW4/3-1) TaxID=378806 RepID=Q08P73_STIAD|nr:hypothetical protein [Stigmatella aurantiaca]ADO68207.1 uncharacterized protein STAUR_0398 [Stigmatella aurantiaca DW4/3-1]EAU62276.1 hypothetical protein STIAU_1816 [Stigmatella aurantiaca DW4/3-1]